MAGEPEMRILHSLLWLLLLSSLLVAALPITFSTSQLYVFISSWNGSQWTSPAIVTKIDYANATRDCYQRKVFKSSAGNYFVSFFNLSCHSMQYVASSDRSTWAATTNLTEFGTFPLGSADFQYPDKQAGIDGCYFLSGSNGATSYWTPFTLSGLSIVQGSIGGLGGQQRACGTSVTSNLGGTYDLGIFHRTSTTLVRTHRSSATSGDSTGSVPFGDPVNAADSGGNQILNYKTSSPYNMMALSKGNDKKMYWSLIQASDYQYVSDPFNDLGVTLGLGFNDFCATTEAQNLGDPEKIHLVFGNSTALYYMKFESDAWSSVTNLGVTGSFPTLAADDSGSLILTYTANNMIYYKTKTPAGSWSSSHVLGSGYTNAAYLSCNQNEDSGEILLVWTANYVPPAPSAPSNTSRWIGIAAPHVYAAITLWSLAMIIGVGAALARGMNVADLPFIILIGLGILICLFVSLAIMSGFMQL